MKASHVPEPRSDLRQALYAGVIGSLGVTVAWLLWVAIHAFEKNKWDVLFAPAIGAVVGSSLGFLRRLVCAAAREARDGPSPEPDVPPEHRQRIREAPDYTSLVGAAGLAGAFLVNACDNLVGDLMHRLITPFLVTLAIFFPVGIWLGFVFRERDRLGGFPTWVGRGLLAGAGAAAIAFLVSAGLGLATFDFDTLLGSVGWWALMGVGWGLCYGALDDARPFAGVLGTALAAVLMVVSASVPQGSSGVLGLLRPLTDRLTGQALAYPGLPVRFWDRSVAEFAHAEAEAPKQADPKQADAEPAGPTPVPPQPGDAIAPPRPLRLGTKPPPLLQRAPEASASPTPRQRILERELGLGAKSELVRSWLVLLLFSAALGGAQWLERRLRPRDYHRSETRRNERKLGAAAAVLWLAAMVYVGVAGW